MLRTDAEPEKEYHDCHEKLPAHTNGWAVFRPDDDIGTAPLRQGASTDLSQVLDM